MRTVDMWLTAAVIRPVGDPLAFYEIAATVIPLIFVALIFEGRMFSRMSLPDIYKGYLAMLAGVFAFAGEYDAFEVLASRHPTAVAQHGVKIVLLMLGVTLVMQPLAAIFAGADRQIDALDHAYRSINEPPSALLRWSARLVRMRRILVLCWVGILAVAIAEGV